MDIDANEFFRQATMRICGSLDIETAMWKALEYLEQFIPLTGMNLVLGEPGMPAIETLAQVSRYKIEKMDRILSLPSEVRSEVENQWANLDGVSIINKPEMFPPTLKVISLLDRPDMSIMTMRLKLKDNRYFALVTYLIGPDQYESEHARLLSMLHDPFAIAMSNALRHEEVLKLKEILADDNRFLYQEMLRISGDEIIGKNTGLKQVFDMVNQVASVNIPVLLLGETGVGKEVIANAIHYSSPRKNQPFIKVNCGAIPGTLIDSELFGHEKGAFTGALFQKRGRFERADKGTILLDEIGELPQEAQVRLLRVLQDKQIERVGGTMPVPIDVRVIASTNRDLKNMVISKQFREDLWFRLNVYPIKIPPLRERQGDIPELVYYFINRKSIEKNITSPPNIDKEVIDQLKTYNWPGNVRELENIVERILIQSQGQNISGPLMFEDTIFQKSESGAFRQPIPIYSKINDAEGKTIMHLKEIAKTIFPQFDLEKLTSSLNKTEPMELEEIISLHIQKAIKITGGKINGPGGAAELLNINPNTLKSKIRKMGLLKNKRDQKIHFNN
ncbi:MAG: sigma 54-interacting transcriptional regulator [Proteobacteria bacterium]|nr:sigma 54-interacting transcriptional regulator [Pseudomonadota bacterium]